MSWKKVFNIPFILFLFSLTLRLNLISKGPYHVDCLNLAIQAKQTLITGQLHNLFGFGYPLTVLLGSFFISLCSLFNIYDEVFAVNLMSVVLSSLTVVVNYFFVAQLLNPATALFSSLMLSVFPIFLGLSVYGTSHIPTYLFLELGLWFLLKHKTHQKNSFLILGALFIGCMGANRIQDLVLMLIPINFFYLCFKPDAQPQQIKNSLMSWIFFNGIIFVIAAGFHLPFLFDQNRTEYSHQLSSFASSGLFNNFTNLFTFANYAYSFNLILICLTHIGGFLSLLGFIYLGLKKPSLFLFLLLWFLSPLLFYGNLNTTVSRFLMISAIPLIIAQGYYFSVVLQLRNKLFSVVNVLCFSAIVITLVAFMFPRYFFRHQYALLPEFAQFVGQHTPANAKIITADEGLFISHYGKRNILYKPGNFESNNLSSFKNQIDSFLAQDIPVYITSAGLYSYDAQKILFNFLKENYQLEYTGEHLTEDWHHGEIIQRVGIEKIFLLKK